jgi:hypothetical protein
MKTHLCSLTPSQDYVLLWHTYTVTDSYHELSDEDKELVWDYELALQNDDSPWYDYCGKITKISVELPSDIVDTFIEEHDLPSDLDDAMYEMGVTLNDDIDRSFTSSDGVEVWFEVIRQLYDFLNEWNSSNEINIVIEDGKIKSFN